MSRYLQLYSWRIEPDVALHRVKRSHATPVTKPPLDVAEQSEPGQAAGWHGRRRLHRAPDTLPSREASARPSSTGRTPLQNLNITGTQPQCWNA